MLFFLGVLPSHRPSDILPNILTLIYYHKFRDIYDKISAEVKFFMRSILFLLVTALAAIVNIPSCIYWHFHGRKDQEGAYRKATAICHTWIRPLMRIAGVDLHKEGEENLINDRPVLYVGNHQGDMDILLIMRELEFLYSIIAKIETKKIPIVSQWMANANCIFMDRGNPRQTLESIKRAQELLSEGRTVVVFPEGTRSQGPEMNEFKPGAFRCAVKAGVPIVPFVIDGSYKVFEQQRYLKKADVFFHILPAIEPEELKGMKTPEVSALVQQRIQDELYRIRETQGQSVPQEERKVWNAPQNS